jgi:hypothetical protein
MVIKYMSKTGLSKEEAEKEVDEYLADKDAVSIVCMLYLCLNGFSITCYSIASINIARH